MDSHGHDRARNTTRRPERSSRARASRCDARPLIGQPAPTSDLPKPRRLAPRPTHRRSPPRPRARCQVASTKERRAALADLDTLALNHVPGLCHADASPWNVLAGKHERLYLIDPRGISGEVSYDAAIIALKAAPHRP
ncbi:phosphotransferase [Actinocatenispora sera]|uniref:phosphotransferase n=1 Tax=Actinocatenispora sera TaxID=390989 RepID=UPI001BB4147D